MHKKSQMITIMITLLIMMLISLTACSTQTRITQSSNNENNSQIINQGTYTETNLNISKNISLKSFNSKEDYKKFLEENQRNSYGYSGGIALRKNTLLESVAVISTPRMNDGAVTKTVGESTDYSETNNQVVGVDEADILKTDGEYIYTLSDNTLHIIKAYPGEEAKLLYSNTFDNRPVGLFVKGDVLALFSNTYDNKIFDSIGFRPNSGLTTVTLYNISDKSNPKNLSTYQLEGQFYDARLIGNTLYLILRDYSPQIRTKYPTPLIVECNNIRTIPIRKMYHFDIPYHNPELVMIHAISLDGNKINSASISADNIQTIYMSKENLYIISEQYISEYELQQEITRKILADKLTMLDKTLIEKIKKTDDDVLSHAEKEQKIMQVYYQYIRGLSSNEQDDLNSEIENALAAKLKEIKYFEYSVINKVKVDGTDIEVNNVGKVPGQIVNQFSLDEYKNNLRIATTINPRWSRFSKQTTSTNNVWVLDSSLNTVGKLTNLADNERIYSTRFIGDKLYMVTFKQVDPFFVIDLSNPKNPKNLGELKIPGFSRYLHPYDKNHIIGIGQETTSMGRPTGLKISLFDVTDVKNPKEVAKFVTDEKYAQSTALYEHKAFLFDKEKELLVIPAYYNDYQNKEKGYNGALVFNITSDDIKLRGLIDHSKNNNWYSGSVQRSLYIGDLLYTKSRNLLRINNLSNLSSVKNIDLKPTNTNNMPVY